MTYTQEELENKTDHQLNVIVSRLRQPQDKRFYRSYCDNWNACGDLIDELSTDTSVLSIGVSVHGEFVSYTCADKHFIVNQGHKRALTIIYTLIKQG